MSFFFPPTPLRERSQEEYYCPEHHVLSFCYFLHKTLVTEQELSQFLRSGARELCCAMVSTLPAPGQFTLNMTLEMLLKAQIGQWIFSCCLWIIIKMPYIHLLTSQHSPWAVFISNPGILCSPNHAVIWSIFIALFPVYATQSQTKLYLILLPIPILSEKIIHPNI